MPFAEAFRSACCLTTTLTFPVLVLVWLLEYPMGWARRAWMAVTLLAFAAGNATAAEPKRVLLLHSFGWNFQAEDAFGDYLRTDLAEKSPYPLDAYEVLLEIARFNDGERDEAFVSYLRALFASRPPDLIITMVSPAARFIQRHRRRPVSFNAGDFCCSRRESHKRRDAHRQRHDSRGFD